MKISEYNGSNPFGTIIIYGVIMKNKNLIVTSESSLGFVHGEHEFKSHRIWDIEKTPCIEYQGSLESLSYDEIYWFGLYLLKPTNIFNTKTGEIKTTIYSTAITWLLSFDYWCTIDSSVYPIYNITNQYIGYTSYGKTHYTSLYKAKGHKYLVWFIEYKSILPYIILQILFIIITIVIISNSK